MHPVTYLVLQYIQTVWIIGFTRPESHLRAFGFIVQILCVAQCIPICMPYMVRTPWAALVGGYAVTYLYHYLDVAMLSRWSFFHNAPVSGLVRPSCAPKPDRESTRTTTLNNGATMKGSFLTKIIFGLKLASTFRFIGTPFEVRNTPKPLRMQRNYRRVYLWKTFGTIVTSYILLDVISSVNDPVIASKYLGLDKIPLFARIDDVTAEEIVIRFFTVLVAGISLNCVQGGLYHILALLAVAMHISEPEEWPPFYGSPSTANTLDSFWNVYWHQTNARKFSSISHYTVHNWLGFLRGTVFARYLRILVAFLSSGVMHLLDDFASGVRFRDSGAMRFFALQALGIVVEDIIIKRYRSSMPTMPRAIERCIGYVWVAVFLTWTVPAYMYPMMWRTNQGFNDSTIPFSFFGPSVERTQAFACMFGAGLIALFGGLSDSGSAPATVGI